MLVCVCVWLSALVLAQASAPVPTRPDGHALHQDVQGTIVLEAFYDFSCPDCQASWPTVKEVLQHYGPTQVEFILHDFPLPYHINAFTAHGAARVVETLEGNETFWDYVDVLFDQQSKFYSSSTINLTYSEVVDIFAGLAEEVGVSYEAFIKAFNDPNISNYPVRTSWKYSCAHYVSGTPTYFLNGIECPANSQWTYDQWLAYLDPFLVSQKSLEDTCPAGYTYCDPGTGSTYCCSGGEYCIQNVGCRC